MGRFMDRFMDKVTDIFLGGDYPALVRCEAKFTVGVVFPDASVISYSSVKQNAQIAKKPSGDSGLLTNG
jgi:hypothetical protein